MSGQLLFLLLASVITTDDRKGCEKVLVSNAEALKITMEERLKHKRLPSQLDSSLLQNVRLSTEWAFWFEDLKKAMPAGLSSEEWLKTLSRLESFESYGDLMSSWNALLREASFPSSRLYLFKKGIRPLWEDKANSNGGKLLLIIPVEGDSAKALEDFLKVLVSIICSDLAEQVCGLTFALREASTATLAIWTPKHPSEELKEHLSTFVTVPGMKIGFKPHKMCARQHSGAAAKPAYPTHRRRPNREVSSQQKTLRPPPGFEGSAPSRSAGSARAGVYQPPSLRGRQQKRSPATKRDDESSVKPEIPASILPTLPQVVDQIEEQQPIVVAVQEPPVEAEQPAVRLEEEAALPSVEHEAPHVPSEEEVKARKQARRRRQRENQKHKKRCTKSSSSKSDSDGESGHSEDDEAEQVLPQVASVTAAQQPEVVEVPVAAPKQASFRPSWRAVALSVAAVAIAVASPFVAQAL